MALDTPSQEKSREAAVSNDLLSEQTSLRKIQGLWKKALYTHTGAHVCVSLFKKLKASIAFVRWSQVKFSVGKNHTCIKESRELRDSLEPHDSGELKPCFRTSRLLRIGTFQISQKCLKRSRVCWDWQTDWTAVLQSGWNVAAPKPTCLILGEL